MGWKKIVNVFWHGLYPQSTGVIAHQAPAVLPLFTAVRPGYTCIKGKPILLKLYRILYAYVHVYLTLHWARGVFAHPNIFERVIV